MKRKFIICSFFLPFFCFSQINETFSNGNFTENPVWEGSSDNFIVNDNFQLQSNASSASKSFLFTGSKAINNAVWESWLKITYPTSASNYAAVYIISDRIDPENCNAYYVKVGGTNDEVSLFLQEGTKHTKIIDGADKRTDGNPIELNIKVTRDNQGNFELYSKLASEDKFYFEGSVNNDKFNHTLYFGLLFSNTNTTGKAYYFDDVFVSGEEALDDEPPLLLSTYIEAPGKLNLKFSEPVDISKASFYVDNNIGFPESIELSNGNTMLVLSFSKHFEKKIVYTIEINDLSDLSGNLLVDNIKTFGFSEDLEQNDLLFNEVMFENADASLEYIELANTSEKILDLSNIIFTTRKTDGSLNTGIKIPEGTILLPQAYIAFCSDAEIVANYHHCPGNSNISTVSSWSALNNESATLVLTNADKTEIYDEFTYSAKWHHLAVKNKKGVALEKIHPLMPSQDSDSWHSAASENNYGTPGYKNSQFRDISSFELNQRIIWADPEVFSPDGDGVNDICFIRYAPNEAGYMANISILSANALNVKKICFNTLLSSESFFIWDGTTDAGKIANAGVYVVYAEIFHPEKGKYKQYKIPVVISAGK